MTALRLAGIHVRHVHLHERDGHAHKCIAQRQAGVSVCAGVDYRSVDPSTHLVNRVDQLALAVVLHELQVGFGFPSDFAERSLDVLQRFASIHGGLANPKQVEVRPVDDRDFHRLSVTNTASMLPEGATYPPSKAAAKGPSSSLADSAENRTSIDPVSPWPPPLVASLPFVDWPSMPNNSRRTVRIVGPDAAKALFT